VDCVERGEHPSLRRGAMEADTTGTKRRLVLFPRRRRIAVDRKGGAFIREPLRGRKRTFFAS